MNQNNDIEHKSEEQLSREATRLKIISSRNLSTAALIMAPVSLFFGGVFLSIVALVFGIVSLVKIYKVIRSDAKNDSFARMIYIRAIIGVGISLLSFVLNAYTLAMMMPMIMDILNGENMDEIIDALQDYTANDPGASQDSLTRDGAGSDSVFD